MNLSPRRWPAFLLILLLSACVRSSPWALHDVSGLLPALHFSMTDQDGRTVTARNYRGKILAVYFGYTHCTDVCPVTLTKLETVLHVLGPEAARVRVLFITVDPGRDTAPVLKQFVSGFGPQVVGLRASDGMLRTLAKRYRVTYTRAAPMHDMAHMQDADYEVMHSEGIFIFGPDGSARLVATPKDSVQAIAHDLKRLVASS